MCLMYRIGHQEESCTESVHNSSWWPIHQDSVQNRSPITSEKTRFWRGCTYRTEANRWRYMYRISNQKEPYVQNRSPRGSMCTN